MAGMINNFGQLLDDSGDPRQGPQIGVEAVGSSPLTKGRVDPVQIDSIQPGFAPGATGGAKRRQTTLAPLLEPATCALSADLELVRHRRLSHSRSKESSGVFAPLFHSQKISPWTIKVFHAVMIHDRSGVVTILCEYQ